MHAMEALMSTSVSAEAAPPGARTGNARGESQSDSARFSVESGQKGKRHIAVLWLYPVSELRVTRSITLEPQPPIEKRNAQAFLLGHETYSILVRGHIQQFNSHISGGDYSESAITHNVDQVVVTDP